MLKCFKSVNYKYHHKYILMLRFCCKIKISRLYYWNRQDKKTLTADLIISCCPGGVGLPVGKWNLGMLTFLWALTCLWSVVCCRAGCLGRGCQKQHTLTISDDKNKVMLWKFKLASNLATQKLLLICLDILNIDGDKIRTIVHALIS